MINKNKPFNRGFKNRPVTTNAPIFRRLNQHFLELDEEFEDQKKELKSDPLLIKLVIYPFIFLFNEFSRKEEKISKEQELKQQL